MPGKWKSGSGTKLNPALISTKNARVPDDLASIASMDSIDSYASFESFTR